MKLSSERRRLLAQATLAYQNHLAGAGEWLASRGIDLEFARSAGLGVVNSDFAPHYHMRGRLAIPYLTNAGPIGLVARCIEDHNCKTVPDHAKMAKPSGQGNLLYGVQSVAWADDWIVVTEGEIDALTWHQIGIPALSVPGAKNWKPHWNLIFQDFSRVYLAEDGDAAGELLWERMGHELKDSVQMIRVKMPDGEDTNSMYVKQGKDYLLGRIKK